MNVIVKGSLFRHRQWWRNNINNDYIVKVIEEGYKLPLLDMPRNEILKNNKSARDSAVFVNKEVDKLLESGVIIALKHPATVVNALSVAKNATGKERLVLDLRQINPMLNVPHYKFEDLKVAANYLVKDCYICVFDLKSGYHHIDIHSAYQQFLGFSWNDKHYMYSSCPFGLSSAGLIFTKVVRELVKTMENQGDTHIDVFR
jgi:hypothetical protein